MSQKEVWQAQNKTNFLRYRQLLDVCPLENVGSYSKIAFAIQKVKWYFTSAHHRLSLLFLKCEKVVPERGENCQQVCRGPSDPGLCLQRVCTTTTCLFLTLAAPLVLSSACALNCTTQVNFFLHSGERTYPHLHLIYSCCLVTEG